MEPTGSVQQAISTYLAIFFTFVAVFYSLRILWLKRLGAREVVFPGLRFGATWWNHFVFRFFRVAIWAICVSRFVVPSTDQFIGIIDTLRRDWINLTGAVLLTLGFALAIASHFSLGESWRSGVDRNSPSGLRVSGLYHYSRNPGFLGVGIAQAGFFLALPSWFSAICLGVGLVVLYRQTLSEERHLKQTFSSQYRDYMRQVRRWI
jgi:protein-S-isoprenylcysteine O-methyltransferase Ste14